MENHSEVFSKGEKTAKIGLVAVVFMGFVKGIAGFLSGSVSLLAQSLDSVTDVFSLVAVSLGMQLSKKPPSERFRYGYYRAETLVSLLVAILILLTGIQILRESASRILSPQPVSTPLVAVAVALLSIPVLYLLHQHMRRVGVEINSQSLINQAEDFKADMYTSIIVMVSVLSSMLGHYIVEGLAGSLISLQVLKLGGTLSWQALLVLMDAVIDPERIIQIKETAEKVRGVKEASRIRIRRSGPFCMGELTIAVDRHLNVEQAHRLSEDVEAQIKKEMPQIESMVIHIEPGEERHLRVALPIQEDRGMESPTTPLISQAPYFLFVDTENDTIESWTTKPNPSLGLEKKRGVTIANLLTKEGVTTLLTGGIGEGLFHILSDSFVEIYELPDNTTAKEAVNRLLEGGIERQEQAKEHRTTNSD